MEAEQGRFAWRSGSPNFNRRFFKPWPDGFRPKVGRTCWLFAGVKLVWTVNTLYEQFASGLFAKAVKTILTLTVLRHGTAEFKRQLCGIAHHAQQICAPKFRDKLPPVQTPIGGLQIADTFYYYSEDRGVAESIRWDSAWPRT